MICVLRALLFAGLSLFTSVTWSHETSLAAAHLHDAQDVWRVGSTYLALGIEHILLGWDHLLFVTGLLFLVGFKRRLIWTITAFTAAHSLTLAGAALGWITPRSVPVVEACIALSIVLVVCEALFRKNAVAGRWPTLLAFVFGLIHGLGFAGALAEIGLPQGHLATALLTFNLGVELGQLAAVAASLAVWRVAMVWPPLARLRTAALCGVGSIAVYWSWLRVAAAISG